MNVLIFGSKGNLGQDLVRAFHDAGHIVAGLDREHIDVTDSAAVLQCVSQGKFDAIVNAVAWNNVDGAEDPTNHETVWYMNASVPRIMAQAAKAVGAAFVHYSTDYVFDGTKREGYTEDDQPRPLSVYGQSKYAGELAVQKVGGQWFVCRLSKLFGEPGSSALSKPSFVSMMVDFAGKKPSLSIVDEEVGMPSYTRDIAEATVQLLTKPYAVGTYHIVNEGPGVTWFGFAEEFFTILDSKVSRVPVPASTFPKPAPRPKFAALRNTKFPQLRSRIDALKDYFKNQNAQP